MARIRSAVALAAALGVASPALAQESNRLDTADRAYATYELLRGGRPLSEELFRLGWPTGRDWQQLTVETSGEAGAWLVQSLLGSGAGLRLSASGYERARAEQAKRAGENVQGPAALLRRELQAYRVIAGAPPGLTLPGGWDPTFLPMWRADSTLTSAWNPDNVGSWTWRGDPQPHYSLDALGFTLLSEVEYASQQLGHEREENLGGRGTRYLGWTGRDGFFALVALHSALAKVAELKNLMFDLKSTTITSTSAPLELDELRYFCAYRWDSAVGADGRIVHTALSGVDDQRSHLNGQAAVLLGLCRLALLCDPSHKGPLADLWKERMVEGTKVPMFEKETFASVVELAVSVFRSMRTQHVDVRAGRAVSVSGGRTIAAADLGLYLMAIDAFMQLSCPDKGPQAQLPAFKELPEEQRKGRTLLTTLAEQIRSWDDPKEPGVCDVYDVKSNEHATRTRSLASQAFCVRGLIAVHSALSRLNVRSTYPVAAEKLMRFLEQDRWVSQAGTYLEPKKGNSRSASLLGSAALLGALRSMAIRAEDGRALMRYRQCLDSLQAHGLYKAPGERTPPTLASEISE